MQQLTGLDRELALPSPGSDRQLAEQAARLHARPLDRSRPLWEIYLIFGLQGGRAAIYSKVHHAAIDGVSGNDALAALLDLSPEGRKLPDPPPHRTERQPASVDLLVRSAVSLTRHPLHTVRLSLGLLRSAPALVASPARPRLPLVDRLLGRDGEPILSQPGPRAPRTPFNRSITQHRRWGFCELPPATASPPCPLSCRRSLPTRATGCGSCPPERMDLGHQPGVRARPSDDRRGRAALPAV